MATQRRLQQNMSEVVGSVFGNDQDHDLLRQLAQQYDKDPSAVASQDYNLLVSLKNYAKSMDKTEVISNENPFSNSSMEAQASTASHRQKFEARLEKFELKPKAPDLPPIENSAEPRKPQLPPEVLDLNINREPPPPPQHAQQAAPAIPARPLPPTPAAEIEEPLPSIPSEEKDPPLPPTPVAAQDDDNGPLPMTMNEIMQELDAIADLNAPIQEEAKQPAKPMTYTQAVQSAQFVNEVLNVAAASSSAKASEPLPTGEEREAKSAEMDDPDDVKQSQYSTEDLPIVDLQLDDTVVSAKQAEDPAQSDNYYGTTGFDQIGEVGKNYDQYNTLQAEAEDEAIYDTIPKEGEYGDIPGQMRSAVGYGSLPAEALEEKNNNFDAVDQLAANEAINFIYPEEVPDHDANEQLDLKQWEKEWAKFNVASDGELEQPVISAVTAVDNGRRDASTSHLNGQKNPAALVNNSLAKDVESSYMSKPN